MTVQELIDKLQSVKDKSIPVYSVELGWYGDTSKEPLTIAEVCVSSICDTSYLPIGSEYFWISSN